MKMMLLVVLALLIPAMAVSSYGRVIKIEFPENEIHGSGSLTPWVSVENTGNDPTSFSIQITIKHGSDSYNGSRWPAEIIKPGENASSGLGLFM